MQRRFNNSIPYIFIVFAVFNIPLENIGISNAHYIFIAIAVVFLLLQIPRRLKLHDRSLIVFVYFLVLASFVTIIITNVPLSVTLKSLLVYIIAPLFWFYYLSINPEFDLSKFKRFMVFLGAIIALLGITQYFGSKTIYGLIPEIDYYAIDFTKEELVVAGSHFRVRSILPSPQIYGLFTSMTFCLFTASFRIKEWLSMVLGLSLLLGSLLSGQRIVILVYAVYFGILLLSRFKRSSISAVFPIVFFIAAAFFLKYLTDTILGSYGMSESNIFNFRDIIAREYNARWSRWIMLIQDTKLFFGNGIGITELRNALGNRIITSESYLVQLFYEGGIFVLGAYVFMYIKSFLIYRKWKKSSDSILLVSLFVSSIVVHSFLNPVFFVYWGIIVYPLTYSFQKAWTIQ